MSTDTSKLPGADQSGGDPRRPMRQMMGEPNVPFIGDWLTFDGRMVKSLLGKAEVGQGIRTSLAQAVAEESEIAH